MSTDRKAEYSAMLKDPRWQKLRLQVFERDGWACVFCEDKTSTLAVHHKRYRKGIKPWEYDPSELVTVCELCHQVEYEDRREAEASLLESLAIYDFAADQLLTLSDLAHDLTLRASPQEVIDCLVNFLHETRERPLRRHPGVET